MKINNLVVECVVVGGVGTNCYIAHKEDSKHCVVVDPGESGEQIANFLQREEMICDEILLTHGHFDHIHGVDALKNATGCKIGACEVESPMLEDPNLNLTSQVGPAKCIRPEHLWKDGQWVEIGELRFQVIHTPGHTKGSCCFYFEEDQVLFSGDTLFMESIGRSDLPTGNGRELIQSLNEKVLVLPNEVKVFPGHGPATDIAYENANNPYCGA